MKLSISVPDDLWAAVRRPDESNSQVIQEALRALANAQAQVAKRPMPGAVGTCYDPEDDEAAVIEDALERLTSEARGLRTNGYQLGVDVAHRVAWSALERLPADRGDLVKLLTEMHLEEDGLGNDAVYEEMHRLIGDWGVEAAIYDDGDDPVESPTFFGGVAQALIEARDAVRIRLLSDTVNKEELDEAQG
jgi:hypothetical protein